ncbi:hypothetical protein G6L37_06510 [Agrobacterium rubi]|nr:hypothetical protein [Agrobacterium rubi]NTF25015.1 hypothetical protein [Agrobacterium rubi]
MTDDLLPYSFDLWFDIKSRQELVQHYASLRQEQAQIEAIMADHGIEFTPDELEIISPDTDQPDTASTPNPV